MVRLKVTIISELKANFHLFQFHNGSIKRRWREKLYSEIKRFQFHNGSIKSEAVSGLDEYVTERFNSTMVRLKGSDESLDKFFDARFNSTMVRLKVVLSSLMIVNRHQFQFHNGSIKS